MIDTKRMNAWLARYAMSLIPLLGVALNAQGGTPSEPIAVFVAGREQVAGMETVPYVQYREQNIVVTNDGVVVVVCQGRHPSKWSDRSGQDLLVKTSDDNGLTWSVAGMISTHGLQSICPNAAVYDRETNAIHVLYNLFQWDFPDPPVRSELGDYSCRQFQISSADQGENWSAPKDISAMVDTKGAAMVVGSGEGIQLRLGPHKGRLILAGGDFNKQKKVLCFYSDDHGITWRRSAVVPWEGEMAWASESKVAELSNGTLVLNSRTFVKSNLKTRYRTRSVSRDAGHTWTLLKNDEGLETVSCNASLIAVPHPETGKDVLLCSLPVGPKRTHGTIHVSLDGGKTWPQKKLVVEGLFAYSSLAMLPDGKLGLFYETNDYREIRLVRLELTWLLE